ncbi:unnamed protein product [Leptidea sinapis]|uniref:Myrosinase 1 n=1 Tax=Leptidea sinapis TaxID=189913 RepID=A0A5E4QV66_9NEOP|nr:unnamed protein product [Leptidea sinapis]
MQLHHHMDFHLVLFDYLIWIKLDDLHRVRKFKKDFSFGVATSAYQVEGAWDKDGKGESIWDRYHHTHSEMIKDGRNGDEACDSYHKYKRDVEMLRELGVHHYKFSISWPRVLPNGLANEINEAGLEYYDNLINELLKYNIQPMVSMYNLDLPQNLQELGGWTNPLVSQWFEDYAEVLFEKFSDRVKLWITMNNPTTVCFETYLGILAPGINSTGIGDYLCVKNVLVAHAKAYRLYESTYKKRYKGKNKIGLYVNPIWSKYGDFPLSVRNTIAKKSKEQGYAKSRLPSFTADEIKLIKATNKKYPAPSLEDDISMERREMRERSGSSLSERYGLYEVDFGSEEKTRKARLSALVYKRIIQKKIIEKDWEPKYWTISISNRTKSDKDEL